ncbi:MAG TPA: trypsin-like peptidase domain-containing protein, partial [Planctomycetota bacterium]|nr:trypsin-like peptidase domain-containing protein [Planctomycetota bacterium]
MRYAAICLALVCGTVLAQTAPQTMPSEVEAVPQVSADFRAVVRQAKGRVFPAVVYVRCLRESRESGKTITEETNGSGVVISPKGEVVTNWHVVDKAASVRCLLYDGRAMDAKVVGKDKDTDLALLQLDLPKDNKAVPAAQFGDSDAMKEGDFVMAMGAPWGLNRSVSIGIISCAR